MLLSVAGIVRKTHEERRELARFLADGTHHRIPAARHMTTGRDRPAWALLLDDVGRRNARR
jgi:hypothetical protein